MIGKTLLHYKILDKLGEGGMGVVYKAEDTKLKRFVALKFLPTNLTADEEAKERFIQEAQAASALDHPNICTIYEINETEDGQLFIAMAYYGGETLKQKVASKQLSVDSVIDIATQIGKGLAKAHQHGIFHRDIKPSNIIVTNDGLVKILDFGLAKLAGQIGITKAGTVLGTVAYMAPEQILNENVDQRADIWAFGVVLYEMLTGQLPFKGKYDQAVMYAIVNKNFEPLSIIRTGVPMELEHLVNKSLAKRPDERYQLVDEILLELESLRKKREAGVVEKPSVKARLSRKGVRFLYGAILFFILLIISVVIYIQQPGKKDNLDRTSQENKATISAANQWQNSIAVLPFKNISPDPEQEFFCDGMTEQLITNLSQLQALKVIARTSVMKFKNSEKTIPEIAKELNVAHVLEGSIRKAGNQIRVNAQLIQANGRNYLWTGEYDRELKDIFAVQDDVSHSIARILIEKLTAKEAEEIKSRGTQNAEAYEYFLKGNYFAGKFGIAYGLEFFAKSESMFKKTIELDSNYALAYAGLARLYGVYTHHVSPDQKFTDLEQRYIETAFRLEPNSAFVNVARGAMYHNRSVAELEKAYESYKRALEVSPNDFGANFRMGIFLGLRGLYHQAVQYFTLTAKLDPLDPGNYQFIGWAHRLGGRFDQAILNYQKALELEPGHVLALNGLARVHIRLKQYEEAEQILANAEKINQNHPYNKTTRAWLYAVKGNREKAFEFLESSQEDKRFHSIIVFCLSGSKNEAIRLLDKKPIAQYEESEADYLDMLHNPIFDILRDTDEFRVALQKARAIYEKNLTKYEKVFR